MDQSYEIIRITSTYFVCIDVCIVDKICFWVNQMRLLSPAMPLTNLICKSGCSNLVTMYFVWWGYSLCLRYRFRLCSYCALVGVKMHFVYVSDVFGFHCEKALWCILVYTVTISFWQDPFSVFAKKLSSLCHAHHIFCIVELNYLMIYYKVNYSQTPII